MRIAVAGALANKTGSGGEAWVRMSWVRGLEQLGFEVWFVEQIDSGTDARGDPVPVARSVQAAYFRRIVEHFGLTDRAALLTGGEVVVGPDRADLEAAIDGTALVNISGHLRDDDLLARFTTRVLVDIDPGFTQFWFENGHVDGVDGHDEYATIGLGIGSADCSIPTGGLGWWPVVQPVVLEDWPVTAPADPARFTTVGNLRGPFGRIEANGVSYGLKLHEQRKVVDLPSLVPDAQFELAMAIFDADAAERRRLLEHGWSIVDPARCADPAGFRSYVQGSGAEFSVAQGIYVETRSGWFSDRTVRYLASGRPAVVQDTGFADHLPVGEGLLTFTTVDEAADAVQRVLASPAHHARAARRIAEHYFGARRVLSAFCDRAGLDQPNR